MPHQPLILSRHAQLTRFQRIGRALSQIEVCGELQREAEAQQLERWRNRDEPALAQALEATRHVLVVALVEALHKLLRAWRS